MSTYTVTNPDKIIIELSQSNNSLPTSYNPPNIVWLANGLAETTGSGTRENPYRINSADDFDGVFKRYYNKPTSFKLYPGTYYTKGTWNFPEQNYVYFTNSSSIEGHSSLDTIIKLDPSAIFTTEGTVRKDTNIFWIGNPYRNNAHMSVKHLTLDGNYNSVPGKYIGGLYIFGNHCIVDDVIVKGIKGSKAEEHEVFGIATINYPTGSWQGKDGGTIISNCIVKEVATGSYVSAFSMGYRDRGREMEPSYFIYCKALSGQGNHFGFAACQNTIISHCYTEGVNYSVYNDTDDVKDWLVYNNVFHCHYAGVAILSTDKTKSKLNVKIKDNVFTYNPISATKAMIGITLEDFTADSLTPYSRYYVENNIFNVPSGIPNPFVLISIKAPQLKVLRVKDNIIPSSSLQNIIDTPNKEIKLINNWDHNGELIVGSLNKL